MDKPIKILIKLPSRGRPERFFKALESAISNIHEREHTHIHCTLDEDDLTMNNPEILQRIYGSYDNISVNLGTSKSKIHAVNRDMPTYDWDVVMIHSDDMLFTFYGFDAIVRQQFTDGNFDKLIHLTEPDSKHALAVLYVAGKDFYNRFGYVYNPEFISLWCDNLVMDIAKLLGTYQLCDCPGLFLHLNPAYGHLERDAMFDEQQSFWEVDELKYNEIKNRGYDLHLYQ